MVKTLETVESTAREAARLCLDAARNKIAVGDDGAALSLLKKAAEHLTGAEVAHHFAPNKDDIVITRVLCGLRRDIDFEWDVLVGRFGKTAPSEYDNYGGY